MSKAKEAALKAYPEKMGMFHEPDIHYEADLNKAARIKYIEGYEQAEKDIVPIIKRLAEAILMDWDNKADVAKRALVELKEYE